MKSPGHREHPEHQVKEKPVPGKMRAQLGADVLAESSSVIEVDEDHNPPRYYFPSADVHMNLLQRSDTTTTCPFKGTAHYFDLVTNGKRVKDAVWSYETPYDEHPALKGRLAFYEENIPGLHLHFGG